jgi:predicted nucleic acid-binding protein
MILTIDTSIAVKWVLDEPGSLKAKTYLPQWNGDRIRLEHVFLAPSLVALELHNTIAKRHRRGEATFVQLAEAHFVLQCVGQLDPVDAELTRRAREMSLFAKHWLANIEGKPRPVLGTVFNIYDCIYIAHAERRQSTLLTADKEQARIAQVCNIPVEFIPSE